MSNPLLCRVLGETDTLWSHANWRWSQCSTILCKKWGNTDVLGHKRIGVGLSVLIVGNGQLQRFVGWRGIQTNATNAVVSLTWRETI